MSPNEKRAASIHEIAAAGIAKKTGLLAAGFKGDVRLPAFH
jgi:hypothetical protein